MNVTCQVLAALLVAVVPPVEEEPRYAYGKVPFDAPGQTPPSPGPQNSSSTL